MTEGKEEKKRKYTSKYTTVSIPISLMKKVDDVLESEAHGYQNRSDFVLDAIRKRLRELNFLE